VCLGPEEDVVSEVCLTGDLLTLCHFTDVEAKKGAVIHLDFIANKM
jgi:hypothetical protein